MTNEELNALVAAEVQKAIASQAPNPDALPGVTPQATAPAPIRVNVGGQVLDYQSPEQLSAALNQTLTSFGQEKAEQARQIAELQAQLAGGQTSKDEAISDTFSQQDFIKNMTDDPRRGLNYALSHMLFDGKVEDAVSALKQKFAVTDVTDRSLSALQFKEAHPEYPGGEQVANIVESVRTQLNMPYNANALDAAYNVAISRGLIPNFPALYQQAQQYQQQNSGAPQDVPDTRTYQGGGVQPYFPNPTLGIQHDPRTFNGGAAQRGIQGAPNFQHPGLAQQGMPFDNPYLRGVPGVGRGGNAPQVDYAQAGEQLSLDQIESIFARSGR